MGGFAVCGQSHHGLCLAVGTCPHQLQELRAFVSGWSVWARRQVFVQLGSSLGVLLSLEDLGKGRGVAPGQDGPFRYEGKWID